MLRTLITDVDGWLSACCIGFMVCLVTVRLLKGSWKNVGEWIEEIPSKWQKGKRKTEDGFVRWWAYAFGIALLGVFIYGPHMKLPPVRETQHNIKIIRKLADNMWLMESDEVGRFRYNGCDDFDNDTYIKPGYLVNHAIWLQLSGCKSIRNPGLGFFYESDEHGNVKEIPNVERATR